jgi:hypothetical protein
VQSGGRVTAVLDRPDVLPHVGVPRRRRRSARIAAIIVVTAVAAGGFAVESVHLRTQVGQGRRALAASRAREATATEAIDDARGAIATALANRAQAFTDDGAVRKARDQAYADLAVLTKDIDATKHTLASTQAAQIELAQYAAQRDGCITGVRRATNALQQGDPEAALTALSTSTGACSAALAASTGARFPYDFPDPSVLRVGSRYYAYSTNSGVGNIQVLESTDLVHWSIVGDALAGLPAWAAPGATWAPSVLASGGAYIAYYTARDIGSGLQCISVAVAFAPSGPFVDFSKAPLVCQPAGSIDPSPFVDASGTRRLLWKSEATGAEPATIWSQPLSTTGLSLQPGSTPTALLTPTQPWEEHVVEAPSMIAIRGVDYLFYSGGLWTTAGYAEGVAVCAGPAGPCRRPLSAPVLVSTDRLGGPGGGAAFSAADGAVWLAYHAFTQPAVGYPNSRTLHFATVRILGGVPVVTPQ